MPVSSKRADELARELEARISMNDLKARRPQAMEELVSIFSHPLHRFVSRVVGQDADAQDVLQTVFTRICTEVGRFEGSPQELRSWIFTIAYRSSIDLLRGRRKTSPLPDQIASPEATEPVDLETSAADVRRAMESLDSADQHLLTLKFQDDFSNHEIARILNVSPNNVGVMLYRAKVNLRRAIR